MIGRSKSNHLTLSGLSSILDIVHSLDFELTRNDIIFWSGDSSKRVTTPRGQLNYDPKISCVSREKGYLPSLVVKHWNLLQNHLVEASIEEMLSGNQSINDSFIAIFATPLNNHCDHEVISDLMKESNLRSKCMYSSAASISVSLLTSDVLASLLKENLGSAHFMLIEIAEETLSCSLIAINGVFNHSNELILQSPEERKNDKDEDEDEGDDSIEDSDKHEERDQFKEDNIKPKEETNDSKNMHGHEDRFESLMVRVLHSVSESFLGYQHCDIQLLHKWLATLAHLKDKSCTREDLSTQKEATWIIDKKKGEQWWHQELSEATRQQCLMALKQYRHTTCPEDADTHVNEVLDNVDEVDEQEKEWGGVGDDLQKGLKASASWSDRVRSLHSSLISLLITTSTEKMDTSNSTSLLFHSPEKKSLSSSLFLQLIRQYGQQNITVEITSPLPPHKRLCFKWKFEDDDNEEDGKPLILSHDQVIHNLCQRTRQEYQTFQTAQQLTTSQYLQPATTCRDVDSEHKVLSLHATVIWQESICELIVDEKKIFSTSSSSSSIPVYYLPPAALLHGANILGNYVCDYDIAEASDSLNRLTVFDSPPAGRVGIVLFPFLSTDSETNNSLEAVQLQLLEHIQRQPETICWLQESTLQRCSSSYHLLSTAELINKKPTITLQEKKTTVDCPVFPCELHRVGNPHSLKQTWKKVWWQTWRTQQKLLVEKQEDEKGEEKCPVADAATFPSSPLYLISQEGQREGYPHGETVFPVLYEVLPHLRTPAISSCSNTVSSLTLQPHQSEDLQETEARTGECGDGVWMIAAVTQLPSPLTSSCSDDSTTNCTSSTRWRILPTMPIVSNTKPNLIRSSTCGESYQLLTIAYDHKRNWRIRLDRLCSDISHLPNPNQFYLSWHSVLPPHWLPYLFTGWLLLVLSVMVFLSTHSLGGQACRIVMTVVDAVTRKCFIHEGLDMLKG